MAFVSNQAGRAEIFVGSVDGAGSPELLPTIDAQFKYVDDWSPDGKFLVFQAVDPLTKMDLWLLPMSGDRKPQPFLDSPSGETNARISPDGRWIAYESDESGDAEVYVQSFPKPGHKVRVSSDGGVVPIWTRGGKELLYVTRDRDLVAVPIEAGTECRPGAPRKLFTGSGLVTGGDVTADGERFLVSKAAEAPHREIRLFIDWTAALEKR
jgi:eukaryotic-like serine/threonine-protein kinase